jgi:prepilin-type processing-associated H-X9-DG protein
LQFFYFFYHIAVVRFRSKASFSLAELTASVGIISILLTIVFAVTDILSERSQRAKGARNLRTIALAHAHFINDFGRAITYTDLSKMKGGTGACDVNLLAAFLAKYGYIKDVSIWAWDFDYLVKEYKKNKTLPTRMYDASTDHVASEFAGKQSGGTFPLSVVCCVVQNRGYDYSQLLSSKFPCACSRGLYKDGKWRKQSDGDTGGVWSDRGGLIAFFDGHVEWYDNIENVFSRFGTNTKTKVLCETLPNYDGIDEPSFYSCFLNWKGNGSFGGIH